MSHCRLLLALLTGLLIAAAATGCRKSTSHTSTLSAGPDTLIAGTVITSAGSWSARTPHGSTKLDVNLSGTSVNWTIVTEEKIGNFGASGGSSSSGSGMGLSSPADPWFVFVETSSRFWMFDGKDELAYRFRNDGGGSGGGQSIFNGKLLPGSPPVPRELMLQLPPELQKQFPHVEPASKRPSL